MAQTEGEKEIVLGNRQLISLFFVVVALCGVFFALGYMMGRPANRQLIASTADAAPATTTPAAQTQDAEPPRETAATTESQDTPAPADSAPAPTGTHPAHDTPAAEETAAPPAPVAANPIVPEAGATYLQVTALRRSDADSLVKTLREQNLPALLADSSKPDLFRVLVGPYHATADVADAKTKLKALGFANTFVQK